MKQTNKQISIASYNLAYFKLLDYMPERIVIVNRRIAIILSVSLEQKVTNDLNIDLDTICHKYQVNRKFVVELRNCHTCATYEERHSSIHMPKFRNLRN